MRRLLGAGLWAASAHYFVAEVVVARAWSDPRYDWARNYISDLGAGTAGVNEGRPVDSPLAWVMNTSFVALGVLATAGAVALAPQIRDRRWRWALIGLIAGHGVGVIAVGLAPTEPGVADLQRAVHYGAALLAIGAGNAALLAAGAALRRDRPRWAAATGALGMLATAASLAMLLPEVGSPGVVERVAAWPVTLWTVAVGGAMLVQQLRSPTLVLT